MKRYLLALLMVLPACAAQAEGLKLADYRGLNSLEDFYVRQGELANPTLTGAPQAVRDCVGQSMVAVAGESRNNAAQRFLDAPTQENLDAFNWVDLATITPEKQAEARAAIEKCAALAN